jgi:hypothetical protein
VSLPGYRSIINLDSKVRMTLWGNVPAFSDYPPVLESTVMLHVPAPEVDLDFTLDHGRVHLANGKSAGPARVRVRFQRESWNLTLLDAASEVVLELWGMEPAGDPLDHNAEEAPLILFDLYVKGKALLQVGNDSIPLPSSSHIRWTSSTPKPAGPETLSQVPAWWTNRVDPNRPQVQDMMLALLDFRDLLNKKEVVTDAVVTEVWASADSANRQVGVMFLGALEAVLPLADGLEDSQHADVRSAASYCLRWWTSRSIDQRLELARTLHEKKGYAKEQVAVILGLLRICSPKAAARPETYSRLIALLNHNSLAVRELAWQQLAQLVPELVQTIRFDPGADADKRQTAVTEVKKRIPEGQVPSRSARSG